MTTNATNPKLTIANLTAFTKDPEAAKAQARIIAARKVAAATRAKVDTYTTAVLRQFTIMVSEDMRPCSKYPDGRITNPEHLYMADLDSPEVKAYFAACDVAHKAHGFDLPAGYCPASVAETEVTKAEIALLKIATHHVGVDFTTARLDMRKRAIELFLNQPVAA